MNKSVKPFAEKSIVDKLTIFGCLLAGILFIIFGIDLLVHPNPRADAWVAALGIFLGIGFIVAGVCLARNDEGEPPADKAIRRASLAEQRRYWQRERKSMLTRLPLLVLVDIILWHVLAHNDNSLLITFSIFIVLLLNRIRKCTSELRKLHRLNTSQ